MNWIDEIEEFVNAPDGDGGILHIPPTYEDAMKLISLARAVEHYKNMMGDVDAKPTVFNIACAEKAQRNMLSKLEG